MTAALKSRIPQIIGSLPNTTQEALQEGLEQIASDAASLAPVGATGELSDSIEAGDEGIYAVWYWFFLEFGTVDAPAQPFMIPAYEAGRERLLETIEEGLEGL